MKKIVITIFLLIILMANNVFAATEVKMEIVEDNICTIQLNEESVFEKRIIESELEKNKITLQLKITNNSELIIPSGELMIVIDSSLSMNEIVEGETTRKDIVLESANKLVKSLLEANPTSLKIGVVTFSTSSQLNDEGHVIIGTEIDAQKVCDFTNNVTDLTSKISAIEGTGQYTNLDSGLLLAKKQFSSENTKKYMIVLTDGLPNVAVGNNDLVTYSGLTEIITKTKSTLKSLENIEIITMLTGINNEEATFRMEENNIYTYGQVINEVFGTEEEPTKGKFYKIDDSKIEQTITEKIYRDLLPIERSLKDITIIDYIPQYIVDNFNISIREESTGLLAKISEDSRTITWNLAELKSGETKALKFDIILKEEFDKTIINKILDTNEKVDINYKNFDDEENEKSSHITPKIKLLQDESTAPEPIPEAGAPVLGGIAFLILFTMIIFFGYKVEN